MRQVTGLGGKAHGETCVPRTACVGFGVDAGFSQALLPVRRDAAPAQRADRIIAEETPQREPLNVHRVVADAVEGVRPVAERRGIGIEIAVPDGPVVLETADGSEAFDAVISTSSPALMARLAPDLPAGYSASLRALKSMGAVVMVLALDRKAFIEALADVPAKPADMERILAAIRGVTRLETTA